MHLETTEPLTAKWSIPCWNLASDGSKVITYQVPYDSFADMFDQVRGLTTSKQTLWLNLFEKHLGLGNATRVLDVGCGTGRFSILIAERFACPVVGIDPSLPMLAKAKAKCSQGIGLFCGKGEAIPFGEGVFDVCLVSQVIHHFENKPQALTEISRVLCPGGRVGIRISSHAQLHTILDYRFFPSALQIEHDRLPDIQVVKDMLLVAGFGWMEEYIVRQPLFESAEDYMKKLRTRYASVLSKISEEEYQRGLVEAAEYLHNRVSADDQYAEITFLVSIK